MHGQLKLLNNSILIMKSTKANATDILSEQNRKLITNFEKRRDNKFIPQEAKQHLRILENSTNNNTILQELTKFDDRCLFNH